MIKKVWDYLLKKILYIISVGLVGGIIGCTYSYRHDKSYIAEVSFALEEGGGENMTSGIATQFGIDLSNPGGGIFVGDNLQELIKSRSMIQRALLTNVPNKEGASNLLNLYLKIYQKEFKNVKLDSQTLTTDTPNRYRDSIIFNIYKNVLKKNLAVEKKNEKLSIITVKVVSNNERFSKFFSEALVAEVSKFYIDTKTKKTAQNVQVLQFQADSVRRALNNALSGVASTSDLNPNPNPAFQILKVPSQRRSVDVQANQVLFTELVKNLELSRISLQKETPLIQIIDSPVFPLETRNVSVVLATLVGLTIGVFLAAIFFLLKLFYKKITSI